MTRIGQTIRDKRVLRLIGRYLRAGAMLEGVVIRSEEGTPQGGPLSPLLANLYLHALDQELERRGLSFCRYADDCNVYVGSQRAAERVRIAPKVLFPGRGLKDRQKDTLRQKSGYRGRNG
jgi:RNA-directed DNA polymerase